ncbi:hypothetical protein ACIBEA_30470 [Streptomyces sp. NPDC051555]|uniref:hypothetical protein n=1 Tax=Streptomyces sp. NPDC051555 TaxID=3365657 RepID=UPI0037AF3F39
MQAFPDAADFATAREQTVRAITELACRAQESGRLRPGFVVDDLILMLMAHQCLHHAPRPARLAASRRFTAYVIEASRSTPSEQASAQLPPAPHLRHAHSSGTS